MQQKVASNILAKMRSSRRSVEVLIETARFIFLLQYLVRKIVQISLLFYYSESKRELRMLLVAKGKNQTAINIDKRILEHKIDKTSEWLSYLGVLLRGPMGKYGIANQIMVTIVFYFFPFFFRHMLKRYWDNDCTVLFLTKPELSRAKLASRFDQFIHETIASNFHFMKHYNSARESLTKSISGDLDTGLVRQLMMFYARDDDGNSRAIIEGARKQHRHLIKLVSDKNPLWPINRIAQWRQKLLRFGISAYYFVSVESLALFLLALIGSFSMSAEYVKKSSSPNARNVTNRERLLLVEDILYPAIFGVHWITEVFVVQSTILLDQYHSLGDLKKKFDKLLHKIDLLVLKKVDRVEEQSFELDCEALDLYLSYQNFNSEFKCSLNLSRVILSQWLTLTLFPSVCMLTSVKSAETVGELWLIIIASAVVISLGNSMAFAHAFMNAQCLKLTEKCWSLVGKSTSNTKQVMTPHTLLLWRRINAEDKMLQSRYTCKIMGNQQVDYSQVIGVNFYIASLVLLFLQR